tara:strand:+ start:1406 stop:1966 length:561 start_codon:yes stop_codon:yes gene_type:complete
VVVDVTIVVVVVSVVTVVVVVVGVVVVTVVVVTVVVVVVVVTVVVVTVVVVVVGVVVVVVVVVVGVVVVTVVVVVVVVVTVVTVVVVVVTVVVVVVADPSPGGGSSSVPVSFPHHCRLVALQSDWIAELLHEYVVSRHPSQVSVVHPDVAFASWSRLRRPMVFCDAKVHQSPPPAPQSSCVPDVLQ